MPYLVLFFRIEKSRSSMTIFFISDSAFNNGELLMLIPK